MEVTAAAAQAATYTNSKSLAEQINDYLAATKTSIATLASEIPGYSARRSPATSRASTRGTSQPLRSCSRTGWPGAPGGRGPPGAGPEDRDEARLL